MLGAVPAIPFSSGPSDMSRLPGLDLLRAVAIILVIYSHAQMLGVVSVNDPVARFGWMGVDLFFALSGFLICGQLFRAMAAGHPADAGGFYLRRAFRTLPAYLVVVVLYFAAPAWREFQPIQPLWQFLTFTENLFFVAGAPKAFSHVWSLCVEEQFYLVAPLMVWLLARRSLGRRALLLASALVAGGIALRAGVWLTEVGPLRHANPQSLYWRAWIQHIYYPSWNRLDGLVFGAGFAFVSAFMPQLWEALSRRADWLLAGGLVGVAVSVRLFWTQADLLPSVIGYPLLSLSMAALVAAGASPTSLIGRFAVPGAGPIAAISYSLYLSHKAAIHMLKAWAGPALEGRPALSFLAYAAAVLIVGGGLYLAVERPFLRLRDRLVKRPAPAAPPLAAEAAAA
jgi:peptidoglycan/LPS O-acetylase OafA/YrhL